MTYQPYLVPVSVKGIVFDNEEVWLRKNERDEWELPGGKIDPGEQPVDTVVRELREELGFTVEVNDIISSQLYIIKKSTDEERGVLVLIYLCKLLFKSGIFEENGEAGYAEFKSFPINQVQSLNMPSFYKEAIGKAFKMVLKNAPWLELEGIIKQIAEEARSLKDEFTDEKRARISWCCVFCQSEEEYKRLVAAADSVGHIAKETHNGLVYIVPAVKTSSGNLRVVKLRAPDPARPERGDADFAVDNFTILKKSCVGRAGFKLIEREEFEMIELMANGRNVLVYFSNPPVEQHAGIREALAKYSF